MTRHWGNHWHRRLLASLGWLPVALLSLHLFAAAPTPPSGDSDMPRHPLEVLALTDPEQVLDLIPQELTDATRLGNGADLALLHLAHANACRMVADWNCQRLAGARAREQGDAAKQPILSLRGLIAEARANISMQDYTRGERLLGEAERRLRITPSAELEADVALAYSTLSQVLGKYQVALQYSDQGLSRLAPGKALSLRVRLLRNRARALAQLNQFKLANDALIEAQRVAESVVDPKLRAELHLEAARLARSGGDRPEVQRNVEQVLVLAQELRNSQLAGHAQEVLGLAAQDAGDRKLAERELQASYRAFASLGLVRDELRLTRALLSVRLQFGQHDAQWSELVQRLLDLEAKVSRSDRAQASDDFDARLRFAEQAVDLTKLEGEARLAREREQALAQRNRMTLFLVLLSAAMIMIMAVFFGAQRRSNRKLQSALDARLRALTQTSHELRNPIGGVLGLSELLLQSSITPAQRGMVEAIRSAGSTIEKLAQDLLDRGRLDSGRLSLSPHPTSLQSLAESIHQLHLPRAREKGLQLLLDLSPDLPDAVMLDAERLQQVLSNLLGNSLKFTDRGEICLSIRARARSSDGRIRVSFSVRDSGLGIDKDEIATLFEPFAQGRAGQRHRAGVGLGLAISADLVRLMDGQLEVESTPGKGSLFHFELTPMVYDLSTAITGPSAGAQGAGLRVLLVDDDEDVSLALRSQLEWLGCEVEQAGSAQAARLRVAEHRFDLVLLDVELPDGHGPDLARAMRAQEPNVMDSRIAIVSGHEAPTVLPSGVDEWLTKPVLLERLNMLLAAARHHVAIANAA